LAAKGAVDGRRRWLRVWRGLRARAAPSVLVLVIATVTVAAAATGPAFLAAARRAVLADALHEAPPPTGSWRWSGRARWPMRTPGRRPPTGRAASGVADLLATRVRGQERAWRTIEDQAVRLVWRDGACAQVRIMAGRCPAAPGEACPGPAGGCSR
jgi:putative ABC transport system permease protein